MEKIKIKQAVLVEGKYDKLKLLQILDANIFTTNGFSIFNNSEKCALLKKIAHSKGLIILTDSDPAGFVIRNKLKGMIPKDKVINIYAPALFGKEARKKSPSKAGILGVEGIDVGSLTKLFERYGVAYTGFDCESGNSSAQNEYTKADMYAAGLSGKDNSAELRRQYCLQNGLPQDMTPNALLEAINLLSLDL